MELRVADTSPKLLFFFVALHGVAIFLFLNGFFLTRYEIQTRSECTQPPTGEIVHNGANNGKVDQSPYEGGQQKPSHERSCWVPRRFKRALFVIVDALRFDFTLYTRPTKRNADARRMDGGGEALGIEDDYYVNNLPIINDLLLNNASNTFLFRFVADAPTTTLQRLKALNTGGIPTFLEAKNNFDSSELSEDNLIAQMRDNGREVVFMGDDTWAKLFPPHKRYFARCHPFPSFNVKDLHTVDDGVMHHLFPEMRNEATPQGEDGWEVIVAHFLGVDHAGHRFGPSHPQMRQKLRQMNGILQQAHAPAEAFALQKDTVLFVMGDHGMTADGNHGGHTESEVTAALFVYSPSPSFNQWGRLRLEEDLKDVFTGSELSEEIKGALQKRTTAVSDEPKAEEEDVLLTKEHFRQVSQIDIVPTIALLLGLPIPFGNLGSIIPELFLGIAPPAYYSFERDDVEHLLKHRSPEADSAGDGDVALDEDGLFFEYLERKWGTKSGLYHHDVDKNSPHHSLVGLRQWLDGFERLNAAMEVNSRQIDAYLSAYARVSPSFPSREIDGLRRHYTRANAMLHSMAMLSTPPKDRQSSMANASTTLGLQKERMVERVRQHYQAFKHHHRFQKQVVDVCRRLWATFDVASMAWGLVLLFASIGGLVFVVFASQRSFDFSFALAGGLLGGLVSLSYSALSAPSPSLFAAFHDIPALVGMTLTSSVIGLVSVPLLYPLPRCASSTFRSRMTVLRGLILRGIAERRQATVLSVLTLALFGLHGIGLFSNSFIEAEHQVISFLLTSALLCYLAASILHSSRLSSRNVKHASASNSSRTLGKTTLALAFADRYRDALKLVALLFIIRFCPSIVGRHESVATLEGAAEDAFPPPIVEPTEASQVRAVSPESGDLAWQAFQFFFSAQFVWDTLVPLSLVLFTFAYALRSFFSSSSSSPLIPAPSSSSFPWACVLFRLHAVSLFCSAVYWAFQRLALLDHFAYLWKIAFPRVVYASSVLSLVILLYLLSQRRPPAPTRPGQLRQTARSLQGTFMVLGMIVCVPVMLVFGPNSCWTFASFLCGPLLFLDVNARMKGSTGGHQEEGRERPSRSRRPPNTTTTAVAQVVDDRDNATWRKRKAKEGSTREPSAGSGELVVDIGRRREGDDGDETMMAVGTEGREEEEEDGRRRSAQLSVGVSAVIVWAFFAVLLFYKSGHLCDFSSLQFEAPFIGFEEMNMITGGVLMVLNTFGCYFLFVLFLPLLLFWPSRRGEEGFTREEVRRWTLRAVWLFMLAFVVKLFLTTLFVFLVRRHLMVWKVFAPKYIFDVSATSVVDLLLFLLYLFVYFFL